MSFLNEIVQKFKILNLNDVVMQYFICYVTKVLFIH